MPDMSADVLKVNLTNPAKTFLWEVMFTNPIGGGDADALDTRCQSTGIPGRRVTRIHIPYKGTAGLEVPGQIQMSHQWRCTFVESTEDRKTFDALYDWHETIMSAKTGIGAIDPSIKSDVYLRMLSQTSSVWLNIKLIGAWPEDLGEVALSYESNQTIQFPVTWSYDRWERVT